MVEMRKDSVLIVFVKKVFLVDFWGPLLGPPGGTVFGPSLACV